MNRRWWLVMLAAAGLGAAGPGPAVARGATAAASAGYDLGVLLSASQTVAALRASQAFDREAVLTDIELRLDASGEAADDLRRDARQLGGEARARFRAALKRVHSTHKAVKAGLKAARRTPSGGKWERARDRLATSIEAHARALDELSSAARGGSPAAG